MSWSDLMADPTQTVIATAAVVAALLVLWGAGARVLKFVRRVTHFLDDWGGEDARPGVPARPGAMARLASLEDRMEGVERDTRQLRRNGGSHLADAIYRLAEAATPPANPTAVATVVAAADPPAPGAE